MDSGLSGTGSKGSEKESQIAILYFSINVSYFYIKTPFLISPTGERINALLPPWGKSRLLSGGKGVNDNN